MNWQAFELEVEAGFAEWGPDFGRGPAQPVILDRIATGQAMGEALELLDALSRGEPYPFGEVDPGGSLWWDQWAVLPQGLLSAQRAAIESLVPPGP